MRPTPTAQSPKKPQHSAKGERFLRPEMEDTLSQPATVLASTREPLNSLVEGIQQGVIDFDILLSTYQKEGIFAKLIYRFARGYKLNDYDRDDMEQELAIRLWQAVADYIPGDASFRTYSSRVLHNRLLDMLDSRRSQKSEVFNRVEDSEDALNAVAIDDETSLSDLKMMLNTVRRQLGPREKTVMDDLRVGYSLAEIGRRHNLTRKQTRWAYTRIQKTTMEAMR